MTRLRIRHSKITHEYLLSKIEPPFCNTCNQQITTQHLLFYMNAENTETQEVNTDCTKTPLQPARNNKKKRYQLPKGDPTIKPDIKKKFQHVVKDFVVDTTLNTPYKKEKKICSNQRIEYLVDKFGTSFAELGI